MVGHTVAQGSPAHPRFAAGEAARVVHRVVMFWNFLRGVDYSGSNLHGVLVRGETFGVDANLIFSDSGSFDVLCIGIEQGAQSLLVEGVWSCNGTGRSSSGSQRFG